MLTFSRTLNAGKIYTVMAYIRYGIEKYGMDTGLSLPRHCLFNPIDADVSKTKGFYYIPN